MQRFESDHRGRDRTTGRKVTPIADVTRRILRRKKGDALLGLKEGAM
jgi:hypothetical protein